MLWTCTGPGEGLRVTYLVTRCDLVSSGQRPRGSFTRPRSGVLVRGAERHSEERGPLKSHCPSLPRSLPLHRGLPRSVRGCAGKGRGSVGPSHRSLGESICPGESVCPDVCYGQGEFSLSAHGDRSYLSVPCPGGCRSAHDLSMCSLTDGGPGGHCHTPAPPAHQLPPVLPVWAVKSFCGLLPSALPPPPRPLHCLANPGASSGPGLGGSSVPTWSSPLLCCMPSHTERCPHSPASAIPSPFSPSAEPLSSASSSPVALPFQPQLLRRPLCPCCQSAAALSPRGRPR